MKYIDRNLNKWWVVIDQLDRKCENGWASWRNATKGLFFYSGPLSGLPLQVCLLLWQACD
eukprot:scaffold168302_cov35-Prasinocladus_malaysianus.AAC.1